MRYGKADFPVLAGASPMFCRSLAFLPHFKTKNVHVHLTAARSESMIGPMMEASTVWIEEVASSGFTACVKTSGAIKISRVSALEFSRVVSDPKFVTDPKFSKFVKKRR